jgi:ribosome modulation factor
MVNHVAYGEGYDAYWEGADGDDDPYDEDVEADARLAWQQGWRTARQHDYDESEG